MWSAKKRHLSAVALGLLLSLSAAFGKSEIEVISEKIKAVTEKMDYLPLNYPYDGVLLSSFYTALELVAETDLSVGFRYVEAEAGTSLFPELLSGIKVSWFYQGAPMVWPSRSSEPLIIDLFVDSSPMPESQYLKKLHATSGALISWAEGSNLVYNFSIRDQKGPKMPADIPSQDKMAPFNALDIADSCTMMRDILGAESGLSEEQHQQKLLRMKMRTKALTQKLVAKKRVINMEYQDENLSCWPLE